MRHVGKKKQSENHDSWAAQKIDSRTSCIPFPAFSLVTTLDRCLLATSMLKLGAAR